MDQSLTLTYNLLVLNENSTVDWSSVVSDAVQAVIIRLSHGVTQDSKAQEFMASAKTAGLYVHGYHDYEGVDGEVEFSLDNATSLGLATGAYLFLMDAPDDVVEGFTNNWLSAGWEVGTTNANDDYYRLIVSDDEPDDYDVWQFEGTHAFDATGNLTIDPVSPVPVVDSDTPSEPGEGAYVGFGTDTTGYLGGEALGYSTNGDDFYATITPFGIVFRQPDFERMSNGLINRLKLQSPNGTVFYLAVTDSGELKAVKKGD